MAASQSPPDDKRVVAPVQVDAFLQQTDAVSTPELDVGANGDASRPPRDLSVRRGRLSASRAARSDAATFFRVFGYLGLPMVAAFVLSALWTFTLAFIQVFPNEMANAIMNTTQFDDGQFWLLHQPDTLTVGVAVVLLVLFGLGYLWLAVYMAIRFRTARLSGGADHHHVNKQLEAGTLGALRRWVHRLQGNLTPVQRHYVSAALDAPKLIFQTLTLFTYLRHGFPPPLIFFYSALLLANWLASSYRYHRHLVDPQLSIARLFYMFDLFFAVFSTLVVLVYFVHHFRFDRAAFDVKQLTLSPMNYDRIARLYGDPAQISSFSSAFHYLQLSSGTAVFLKAALNLLSLYKWRKIIHTLIVNHQTSYQATVQPTARRSTDNQAHKEAEKTPAAIQTPHHQQSQQSHRAWPMWLLGAAFFLSGLAIFVYSVVAVQSTADLCQRYTRCSIYSYQWNVHSQHCTCLMFVDRREAPESFAEWLEPEDTTASLDELAVAGELRIVQIINRAVPELPDSLRRCVDLERVILIYTKTESLPDWMADLTHMEYLHIEDDLTPRRLRALPAGLFDRWTHLTFLHFGSIVSVPSIPSLSSLHHLQYLVLVGLESMATSPSLDGLVNLNSLLIADATHIPVLPALAPLKKLRSFALRFRNAVCCNGYLTGQCDRTAFECLPRAGEPQVQCTDARIPEEDAAVLKRVDAFYCPTDASDDVDLMMIAPTQHMADALCGGVMYKRCELGGRPGMCYNSRMQVVHCVVLTEYQDMRRLQIERGVGDPCDVTVEAWLGCK